jgi:quinol monooxygenase YgiN
VLINVKISEEFTKAPQAKERCLWLEWSRSLADPHEYVLIEAYRDDDTAATHVESSHFRKATQTLPQFSDQTPKIVNGTLDQEDWSQLQELATD